MWRGFCANKYCRTRSARRVDEPLSLADMVKVRYWDIARSSNEQQKSGLSDLRSIRKGHWHVTRECSRMDHSRDSKHNSLVQVLIPTCVAAVVYARFVLCFSAENVKHINAIEVRVETRNVILLYDETR